MKKIRGTALIGIAMSLSLGLAACSPGGRTVDRSESAESGQSVASTAGTPTLTQAQVENIVGQIQTVIDEADESGDASGLSERLTNPALAQRSGQMTRAENTGDSLDALDLSMKAYSSTVDDSWPRVLVIGTEASGNNPAEIYVITQRDAQSNYMLENWVRLIGGNSVTGLSVQSGSAVLAADAEGYLLSPNETLETFIDLLNDPDNEEYQIFNDSTLSPRLSQEVTSANESVAAVGTVTAQARWVDDYPVTAVTLASGQALVSGGFVFSVVYQRTEAGATMTVGGTAASYLDDPNVEGTVTVTYTVNVLFTVPLDGEGDTINVVGAERVIQSVEKDDSSSPD